MFRFHVNVHYLRHFRRVPRLARRSLTRVRRIVCFHILYPTVRKNYHVLKYNNSTVGRKDFLYHQKEGMPCV